MKLPQTIFWVSGSHWDREWHKPLEGFRSRLIDMVDRAIDYVTNVKGYGFFLLDGQSIILEDYIAVRPERKAHLKELISKGRISAGPFYVLQDEMVEDGELLARNLQFGISIARSFGAKKFVGYTPDAFGHCAQLPQVLRLAGVDTTVFLRGYAGTQQENKWIAPDGSEVFFVWLPIAYGGFCHRDSLEGGRHIPESRDEALALFEKNFERLIPYIKSGYALVMDGGDHLMPDSNAVTLARDFNAKHPRGPYFKITSLPDAVKRIAAYAAPARVAGEIRAPGRTSAGWILPGTLTSRMPLKYGLSALTRQLLALEKLVSVQPYSKFVNTRIERTWKFLLQNIPHDSICGCHIDEVYLENITRLNSARSIISYLYERALRNFYPAEKRTTQSARALFYDPSPERGVFKPFEIECPYPCVKDPKRISITAEGVDFVINPATPYQTSESHLTTYRIKGFYKNRAKAHVFDAVLSEDAPEKRLTVVIPKGRELNPEILTFTDGGDAGDTYNYSPPDNDKVVVSQGKTEYLSAKYISDSLIHTECETLFSVPESLTPDRKSRSNVMTDIRISYEIVYDIETKMTRVKGYVRNTARDHRLRVVFPASPEEAHSFSGAPFYVERRPVKLDFNPDEFSERPLTDYPFIDYIRYGGISVYSQSNGEYQITPRGIEVTLCRSVGYIGRPDLKYRKGQGGPFFEAPLAQLLGEKIPFGFIVASSLTDSAADYRRKELLRKTITQCVLSDSRQSIRANLPVRVEGAEISALRWRSKGVMEIRLFNPSSEKIVVKLKTSASFNELFEVDLNHERKKNGISFKGMNEVKFTMNPWQIITFNLMV
ncbi:MAG: hypothetical protein HY350_03710 [Candidatus Omnitrophica bacterium]|nr:hypothetical protein [Candidatus Omnitrophota bacterium]